MLVREKEAQRDSKRSEDVKCHENGISFNFDNSRKTIAR